MGCNVWGDGTYLVSLGPSGSKLVSITPTTPNGDVKVFRRRDRRTGIVAITGAFRQGWGSWVVNVCAAGKGAALACQELFAGMSAAEHCPAEVEPRTDVNDIAITLLDHDGDAVTDIVLTVGYAVWPALTPESALKLDLTTGCAVEVDNPPDASVPVPKPDDKGSLMLVFLNHGDRFEPTSLTKRLMNALAPQD